MSDRPALRSQAHRPSTEPRENHRDDLVAIGLAIVVLLVMVALASIVPPMPR